MSADDDWANAANPGSDPLLLARLAEERPDLRSVLAGNPSTPVYILEWLHSLRDPEIDRALAANRTAVIMGIVRPTAGSTLAPPVGTPMAPPTGAVPADAVIPTAPPTEMIGGTPPTVVPEPVRAAALPTVPPPEAPHRRTIGLLAAIVPLLFLGGCLAAIALARGGKDDKRATSVTTARAAATVTSLATAVLPTQVTNASTPAPPTAAGGANGTTAAAPPPPPTAATEPPTEAPPEETPAETQPPRTAARTPATTARATATTAKTTATTATTATTTSTVAASVVQSFAYTIAQRLATALATNDWATARTISPTSGSTDAQYVAQYGNLDVSTVVPAKATVLSVTTYSLRLGLVAHETNGGVKQTTLYCAHWNVDTAKGVITQVSGKKLRSENGTKAVSTYTAELASTCATTSLA